MGWTLPDKGEGDNNIQSILFQEYLDALSEGVQGINCVVSGCLVTTHGADLTPNVAKGAVLSNGTLFAIAATTKTIGTADATNPRIDLIVVDSSGVLQVRAGAAAAAPKPPARTANDVIIAAIYVPATTTAITAARITDMRVIRDRHGIVLKRQTTLVTFNTTLAIQTYASLVCPSGMLTTGKILRVRCGGNYLSNSGTGTWTLTIAYGGTTMLATISAATVADTDRKGWYVEFELAHTNTNAQNLSGTVHFGTPGTVTQATTGIGNIGLATENTQAITSASGGTAVDSDAADRTLTIQWTMSVSNINAETVCNFATFEMV